MGIFEKIFGSYSQRELKNIRPIVDRVLSLEDKYKAMSDRQLQEQTPALKARLAAGETPTTFCPTRLPSAGRPPTGCWECALSRCRFWAV